MIEATDSLKDAMVKLADGNPGAITVLVQLIQHDPMKGFIDLLHLDDMGMKGSAIWVGYKDFARQDLAVFRDAIRTRDKKMIEVIRQAGYEAWNGGKSWER